MGQASSSTGNSSLGWMQPYVASAEPVTVIPQSSASLSPVRFGAVPERGALVSPGLSVESGSQQVLGGIYVEMKEGMKEEGRKRGKGRRKKEGRGISGLYHAINIRLMDR